MIPLTPVGSAPSAPATPSTPAGEAALQEGDAFRRLMAEPGDSEAEPDITAETAGDEDLLDLADPSADPSADLEGVQFRTDVSSPARPGDSMALPGSVAPAPPAAVQPALSGAMPSADPRAELPRQHPPAAATAVVQTPPTGPILPEAAARPAARNAALGSGVSSALNGPDTTGLEARLLRDGVPAGNGVPFGGPLRPDLPGAASPTSGLAHTRMPGTGGLALGRASATADAAFAGRTADSPQVAADPVATPDDGGIASRGGPTVFAGGAFSEGFGQAGAGSQGTPQTAQAIPSAALVTAQEQGPGEGSIFDTLEIGSVNGSTETARSEAPRPLPIADLPGAVLAKLREMLSATPAPPPGRTEVMLSPAELGRVTFIIGQEDGILTLQVLAERPETLDMMRRHADILQRTAADGPIRLTMEQEGAASQRRNDQGTGPGPGSAGPDSQETAPPVDPLRAAMRSDRLLDIRL